MSKCQLCGKEFDYKPLCLWDATDCFHRMEPCVPVCRECYSEACKKTNEQRKGLVVK